MTKNTQGSELRETWQLSLADKSYFNTLYTAKKAADYIEVIELRNQGLSFREIAFKRKTGVSSTHMTYKNAIKALVALQAYPLPSASIETLITSSNKALLQKVREKVEKLRSKVGKGKMTLAQRKDRSMRVAMYNQAIDDACEVVEILEREAK